MKKTVKNMNWKKLGFEFLSIFIAVTSAFALNNWNENRNENEAANKILAEILNGLDKDLEDARDNKRGNEYGIDACKFWRNIIQGKEVSLDTLPGHYFYLTRDFTSIQNTSGYETLKSKGLELIYNDSLRYKIITLYEFDYSILRKLEEEYKEMQYQESYFDRINNIIAPNFKFNEKGNLVGLKLPLKISDTEKNILFSYLLKMQYNRGFVLRHYTEVEKKILNLIEEIEKKLN